MKQLNLTFLYSLTAIFMILLPLRIFSQTNSSNLDLKLSQSKPIGERGELEFNKLSSYHTGIYNSSAAEILAYDPDTKRLFFSNSNNNTIEVLNIADPEMPVALTPISLNKWGNVNSVAVKNGIVAIAVQNKVKTEIGAILFFNTEGDLINEVKAGALPDMVTFSPNGKYVLCANEGEPNDDYDIDPVGSITIVDISNGVVSATAMNATFESFNDMKEELMVSGVRIFGPNASVAQDLEPEYIAVSADSKTAFVSLQENNALAIVDIENARVTNIIPLGFKDWSAVGNTFDASDKDDKVNLNSWKIKGMYQPDAIAAFEFEGNTYIVSANEGDTRNYKGYSEEMRLSELKLDPTVFPDSEYLQKNTNLGRLIVTTANGDIDGDGFFEEIYTFGARSISIWNSNGKLIWDSGDDIETITSEIYPHNFNSDNLRNNSFDSRSDDKGPEPEGITVGIIAGNTYAFVTLERIGGIMVYNITNPFAPVFVNYFNNRDFSIDFNNPTKEELMKIGDLGPEDVKHISAKDSPNGKDLIVVSNEVSGSISIWSVVQKFKNKN